MWLLPPHTRKRRAFPAFPHPPALVVARMLLGLCALIVCAATDALALDPQTSITQYLHNVWTTDNGLPQSNVLSIKQTRDGYLWASTVEGLVRFNGLDFVIFNPSNTPEMPEPSTASFFEDGEGALWFGTGSLYDVGTKDNALIRYKDGKFTSYADGFNGDAILAICPAREGGLWVGTAASGVYRFKDGHFQGYTTRDGLSDNSVRAVLEDRNGTLWVGSHHGLDRFGDGRFSAVDPLGSLAQDTVRVIYEDTDDSLLLGTLSHGLIRLKDGQATTYTTRDGLYSNAVKALYRDRDGNLWVGTEHGRLHRFRDGKVVDSLSLSEGDVLAIYEDREGCLWVATDQGLNKFKDVMFTSYTAADGVIDHDIWGIYEDREGNIWISTRERLVRLNNGKSTVYTTEDGLLDNYVGQAYQDSTGAIWVGSRHGLNRFKGGRIESFPRNQGAFWSVFHEDAGGSLWIGNVKGLSRFKDGEFFDYPFDDKYQAPLVWDIKDAGGGALWLATNVGLLRFKDEQFTLYSPDPAKVEYVDSINIDTDGTLWLGTIGGGLLRFKDGRFTRYTVKQGLSNNTAYLVLDDGLGYLWMDCSVGIFRVSKQELTDFADGKIFAVNSTLYDTADGMRSRECSGQNNGLKSRDGRLWFPTLKGVAVVDPAHTVRPNTIPPPVTIEQASADDVALNPREETQLQPGTRKVEFHYAGLSLVSPEKVKYRYKLEGFDRDWVEAGTRRAAYYTNLPAGSYTFRVIAANNDGVWNMEGAGLTFIVRAPFWQRWWFWLLCGTAVAAVAFFIYRTRVAQLKRRQAAQEAFSRQLIESQEQERKRIAAELHDSLGQNLLIIKNQAVLASLTSRDVIAAKGKLDEISAVTSQAIEEVRQIAHNLRPHHLDNLGLTKSLEAMIEKVESSSRINFTYDIAQLDGALPKENEISLYRIVQEAINNIVKHSAATRARIDVVRDEQNISVMITDNGKGFDVKATANAARGGFGLTGMAERVRMIGGTYHVESVPGVGTTVNVSLKSHGNGKENGA